MSPIAIEAVVLPLHNVEYLQSTVVALDSSRGCCQLSLNDRPLMPVQLGDGYWYGSACGGLISLSQRGTFNRQGALQKESQPDHPPEHYN